jgi:hypothetical protein
MSARELVVVCAVATMTIGCSRANTGEEVPDGQTADAALSDVPAPDAPPNPGLPAQYPLKLLQLNLCNSGFAACYDGGLAIAEGVAAIQAQKPDIVTLNEICKDDLPALTNALASVHPGRTIVAEFKAAGDRRITAPYKCMNGQEYGIGLVAHIPGEYAGHEVSSGLYATQDTSSAEERAWLCVRANGTVTACTTHLATVGTIALAQCNALMGTIVPAARGATTTGVPAVVGGDFNLKFNGSPNVQDCVPTGFFRKGDGDVQHIFATMDLTFKASALITMTHTDHDGWFVEVTAP